MIVGVGSEEWDQNVPERMLARRRKWIFSVLLLMGCGFFPEKVSVDDKRVQELLKAANAFDRVSHGFTPIPITADIRLESQTRRSYDVMLHISSSTSRTIAFRKTADDYRWIGEQESFRGPKQYTTVDGTSYEQIVLTYHIEKISSDPLNKLIVNYFGEDARLVGVRELTLEIVKPILKEWGY